MGGQQRTKQVRNLRMFQISWLSRKALKSWRVLRLRSTAQLTKCVEGLEVTGEASPVPEGFLIQTVVGETVHDAPLNRSPSH